MSEFSVNSFQNDACKRKNSAFRKSWKKSSLFSLPIQNILQAAKTTQRWHEDHSFNRFKGGLGISPDLHPIGNFCSQMKKPQQKRRTTSIVGLKEKHLESLETSQTRYPRQALQVDAEANGSRHSGPGQTLLALICLN